MKYVPLGATGVKVSELCLGTMSFGGEADEAEATAIYKACRDRGVNFFDCADVYAGGRSEEVLGRLIKGERDSLVITSKCHGRTGDDINDRGNNRRHIMTAVEASLKRLGTDRLDVYFLHHFDPAQPIEEMLRALENLVQHGKVLYLGCSNYAAWQIAKALGISERRGWSRFDVIQPMYSLLKRQAETEILPLAAAENLGVITYSPVAGGVLSGKYAPGTAPNAGRLVTHHKYADRYGEEGTLETAQSFAAYARENGYHPISLAVAWVKAHPAVTAPIIGTRTAEQIVPSLDAADIDLTPDERAAVSALSRTPPPATDRREEQLEG
jgi:aryl-alcohol dehydrogenase-like predicted oxidoreductase